MALVDLPPIPAIRGQKPGAGRQHASPSSRRCVCTATESAFRVPQITTKSSPNVDDDYDVGRFGKTLAADTAAHNISLRRQLRTAQEELRISRNEILASRHELAAVKDDRLGLYAADSSPARSAFGNGQRRLEGLKALAQSTTDHDSSGTTAQAICLHYLYASPLQVPRLDIDGEVAIIEEALAGKVKVHYEVASIASLGRVVIEQTHWIHISAHSCQNGSCLVLEDENWLGEARLASVDAVEKLFKSGNAGDIVFVFLSVCESARFAHALHAAGVQHVVFCPTAVRDNRARLFSRSLYSSLARHLSLEHAFSIARCTAELSGDDAAYGLLSRGSLRLPPSLRCPSVKLPSFACYPTLKRKVEDFVGRLDVLRAVLRYLSKHCRRAVFLHCEVSLGRSATLTEIAHLVTTPGRKSAGHGRCAFFPDTAPGGLLIVDDFDALSDQEKEQLQYHLEADGAQVLAGCRCVSATSLMIGDDKPMCVQLPPLQDDEAAELFLLRCQRALLAEDLVPLKNMGTRNAKEVISRPEALQLLKKQVPSFGGVPGQIRCAVDKWARTGSPCLHGEPGKLSMSVSLAARSKFGPRWM